MKFGLLLLLWATCALGQSLIPNYEPEQLAKHLKDLQTKEENCKHTGDNCEYFEQDELIRKEIHTSLEVKGCSEISATHARLDGLHDAGFVRMQCGWDLNLVFTQQTAVGWRFLQTVIVPNHYWRASVSFASVTGNASQQVLVHKAQQGSGTGANQQNFIVYQLRDGKLRPVLDVVESAYLGAPWTKYAVSQESRFVFEPPIQGQTQGLNTPPIFTETQVLEFSGMKVELKREHAWSDEQHTFIASQWFSARRLMPPKKRSSGNRP